MSDDDNDIDDKVPLEPRKRRGAGVPNIGKYTIIEMLPTLAAITVLRRMSYREINLLCLAGSLFSYRFCGGDIGKSKDLEAIIDAYSFQQTADLYVMLFQRDWGISRKPSECLTSVPGMRQHVADSMEYYFPRAKDGVRSQIVDMRNTYLNFYKDREDRPEYAGVVYFEPEEVEYEELGKAPNLIKLRPLLDVLKGYNGDDRTLTIPFPIERFSISVYKDQRFGMTVKSEGYARIYFLETLDNGETTILKGKGEPENDEFVIVRPCDLMVRRTDKFANGIVRGFYGNIEGFGPYVEGITSGNFGMSDNEDFLVFRSSSTHQVSFANFDYEFVCLPIHDKTTNESWFVLFYREELPRFDGTPDEFLNFMNSEKNRSENNIVVPGFVQPPGHMTSRRGCSRIDEPGQNFDIVLWEHFYSQKKIIGRLVTQSIIYTTRVEFDTRAEKLVIRGRHMFKFDDLARIGGDLGCLRISSSRRVGRIDYRQNIYELAVPNVGERDDMVDRFGYTPLTRLRFTSSLDDYKVKE